VSAAAERFDVLVLGSGPAGQKAAIQAAKEGRRTAVVEQELGVGGACVHRGTIPSKTLRETAVHLAGFRVRVGRHLPVQLPPDLQLASLMDRMERVVLAHVQYQSAQLQRNGVELVHGRARFQNNRIVQVESVHGAMRRLEADVIVIATGSRPRTPPAIPVDHEHVLDSDSILSMSYLPETLTVLGGGVVATEYATIFAALGSRVTMIDKAARPLAFLDREVLDRFVTAFECNPGCVFVGGRTVVNVAFDGVSKVVTTLDNGWTVASDRVLCALGRVANVSALDIAAAGLGTDERGHIPVDADCRTRVPHIFAVGDVIGPPALASTSMDQGRRAVRAALGLPPGNGSEVIPVGIYAIPEVASVGLDEAQTRQQYGDCIVGRSSFHELARGQIAGCTDGMLKLVTEPQGLLVVGCQIIGEGATELIHLAQMAITTGATADTFVETIFNFPTLAEAYRVAALDAIAQYRARHAARSS
jgi:NAD(P) transhydrogenase